jgi:exosome complex component RRP4
MLYAKNREIVVPGQLIADGSHSVYGGAFREGNRIYSSVVGLVNIRGQDINVVPLGGRYIPRRGDAVIGVVIDSHYSGWILDLNSPYVGNLFVSDFAGRKVDLDKEEIGQYLGIGDVVMAEIKEVDERMRVLLDATGPGMGKIKGGKMVEISSAKIPRVIGKKGSMAAVLQSTSGCKIKVGQNGRIIVWGDDRRMVNAVVEALLMIEREAHTSGLTDRVKQFLEKMKSEGK